MPDVAPLEAAAPPAALAPLAHRVYAGAGEFFGAGSGPGLVAGYERGWPGGKFTAVSDSALVVPGDPTAFLPGLPEGQAAVYFGSAAGGRFEPWPTGIAGKPVSPHLGVGIGYGLLLPVLASGLTGYGQLGATVGIGPKVELDGELDLRVIWFFGDPIELADVQVGLRF